MRLFILSSIVVGCIVFGSLPLKAHQTGKLVNLSEEIFTSASGQKIQAELGELIVPENREKPNSTPISISFIRLRSTSSKPDSPLVYLEGGPGSSCTWMADNERALERWLPILAVSDVILFDQRGTGAASERMTWINFEPRPEDFWVTEAAANAHYLNMAERALADWEDQGVDLAGYTTLENAKDLEELRAALGISKISILGFSYGTHLGQVYLKYFEDQVDKAILIGVEGLDETFKQPASMDAQFHKLSQMAAADPAISKAIPNLVELYQRVSQKLKESPITLTVRSPLTGEEMDVKIGKYGLDFILRCDIGDASDLPIFPRLLYTMDQGDYSVFQWFVQKRISSGYGLHAMATTMDIVSGGTTARKAMIETQAKESLFGNVVNMPYLGLAEIWPIDDLGPSYRSDFTTQVPVLLLSGTLDFNTPPYQAERLRWNLPNAQHIVVQNAGHEQIQNHPNSVLAITKFLKTEDISTITAAYPPLQFIPLSGEVEDDMWHPALGE